MEFLAKTVTGEKLMELSQSMAESLVQGLLLAKKAARQNQTKAVKDATAE